MNPFDENVRTLPPLGLIKMGWDLECDILKFQDAKTYLKQLVPVVNAGKNYKTQKVVKIGYQNVSGVVDVGQFRHECFFVGTYLPSSIENGNHYYNRAS